MHSEDRHRKSARAVNLGLTANVGLAAVKTLVGVMGHSPALLADGINSTSDVAYYLAVKIFMRLSRQPPDQEHPYGHSQLESIGALVVGAFVITTAVAIFWDAVNAVYDLFTGQSGGEGAAGIALWVALGTIAIKLMLTAVTRRLGRETRNPAVLALAQDHRNDLFSASAAAIGIFVGRAGLPWVDPLAASLVALVVLWTGIGILRDASLDLMDTLPGQRLNREIRGVLTGIPGVLAVEEVHAHRFGPYLVVNIQIGIDGALSVAEGDRIASRVERTLRKRVEFLRRVYVHYHPARGAAPPPDA